MYVLFTDTESRILSLLFQFCYTLWTILFLIPYFSPFIQFLFFLEYSFCVTLFFSNIGLWCYIYFLERRKVDVEKGPDIAVKSLQSYPTLCDPIDGSLPGSPVPGILQARTLEWVAISFSNARKWKVKVKSLSRAWLLATSWTEAYQAPPSMGFSRQEYWSGVLLPSPIIAGV